MCRYVGYLLINLFILGVSPVVTVVLLSAIVEGPNIYVMLRAGGVWKYAFVGAGAFVCLVLYLGDFISGWPGQSDSSVDDSKPGVGLPALFPTLGSKGLVAVAVVLFTLAAVTGVDTYPSAPLLVAQLLLLVLMLVLIVLTPHGHPPYSAVVPAGKLPVETARAQLNDRRDTFNMAQASALGLHGIWVLFIWLYWVADSPLGDGEHPWANSTWTELEEAGITRERFGGATKNVMLYLWFSPVISSMCLLTLAIIVMFFGSLQRKLRSRNKVSGTLEAMPDAGMNPAGCAMNREEEARFRTLVFVIKLLTAALVSLCGCLWVTASVVGSSLSLASTVQAFTVVLAAFLAVYVYVVLAGETKDLIARGAIASPLMKSAKMMVNSEWSKACFLALIFCLVPLYVVLSFLNQLVRKCTAGCRERKADQGRLTARVRQQLEQLRNWPWTGVHRKLQLLCMMAVGLQVVGGMGTNIVLALVNSMLQNTQFLLLAVVYFMVGLGMFMIPIVPGVAVYLFGGILVPAGYVRQYGTDGDYTTEHFWLGFLVTIGLNFVLKLVACTLQQKGIGEPMSTNLSVLQAVGINTPQMKAIELILRRPGLSFGKIVILCGAPDWPVSVLTGILRLSLPQMILGTVPVITNILLVTAAGCFKLRKAESETWSALESVALTIASIWTVLQMALATYYIQETWEKHLDILSKPRKAHVQLDWLDYVKSKQQERVKEFSEWSNLPVVIKVMIFISSALMLISSFFMVMLQSMCWDNFDVTDDISTLGLHFITIYGYIAIGVFAFGCLQYLAVSLWLQCATRQERMEVAKDQEPRKESWIQERLVICEQQHPGGGEERPHQEDLPLLVQKLQTEMNRLNYRVQELEGKLAAEVAAPADWEEEEA